MRSCHPSINNIYSDNNMLLTWMWSVFVGRCLWVLDVSLDVEGVKSLMTVHLMVQSVFFPPVLHNSYTFYLYLCYLELLNYFLLYLDFE